MNTHAMVLASFAGDSLALGAHWVYDTDKLEKTFGRVEELRKPLPDSYHPARNAGEFTHYGDQTFVLLESLAAKKAFDPADFAARWQALFAGYSGYFDSATKTTLSNLKNGWPAEDAGSTSNDLSGACRIAPLVYLYKNDPKALEEAAVTQTRMTHNSGHVISAARFFAAACLDLLAGASVREAVTRAKSACNDALLASMADMGLATAGKNSVSVIAALGQSCHIDHAFPAVIQLAATYENDLKEALVSSVMAGGDSAARNLAVGMLLGARLGDAAIPAAWLDALVRRNDIDALLARLE